MSPIELTSCATADEAARVAAHRIADVIRAAIERAGVASLALSGGRTPALMLAELATIALPWELVHLFQVDERVAPRGSDERNATALGVALVEPAGIPDPNVHLMDVDAADLAEAAARYAAALPVLDAVHLGLGDDGHTASWPPGDPVMGLRNPNDALVAIVGPYRGHVRMTLTPRAIGEARSVLWLVTGTDKAAALGGLRRGDPSLPATLVPNERARIVADVAAAPPFNA